MSVTSAPIETRPSLLPKLAEKPWLRGSSPALVLMNVLIIDPAGGSLSSGKQTVVVRDGKFASISSSSDCGGQLEAQSSDKNAIVVDLEGKYICPGLIDCHVHIAAVPGAKTMDELVRTPDQLTTLRITYVLKEMIRRGFTTVQDTGGASKHIADAIEEGLIEGPRLFQCGKALSQTGGHGDFTPGLSGGDGACCGHSQFLARTADGVPQVLKAVREELKAGADCECEFIYAHTGCTPPIESYVGYG